MDEEYCYDENITLAIVSNPIVDFFKNLATFIFVMVGGVGLTTICVALQLKCHGDLIITPRHTFNDSDYDSDTESDIETDEEFIEKYNDAYNKLEEQKKTEEDIKLLINIYLEENTPRGLVIMYYDFNREGFGYYSDTKDIPYDYLESIAKHYVIENNCKGLLVDTLKELEKLKQQKEKEKEKQKEEKEKEKEKEKEEKEEQEKEKEKEERSVFAKLKTYPTQVQDNKVITKNVKINTENLILLEKTNKYIYKGKIYDYKQQTDKLEDDDFEKIDYNTFKLSQSK